MTSAEVAFVGSEVASVGSEVASVGFEVASVDFEVASVDFEVASVGFEVGPAEILCLIFDALLASDPLNLGTLSTLCSVCTRWREIVRLCGIPHRAGLRARYEDEMRLRATTMSNEYGNGRLLWLYGRGTRCRPRDAGRVPDNLWWDTFVPPTGAIVRVVHDVDNGWSAQPTVRTFCFVAVSDAMTYRDLRWGICADASRPPSRTRLLRLVERDPFDGATQVDAPYAVSHVDDLDAVDRGCTLLIQWTLMISRFSLSACHRNAHEEQDALMECRTDERVKQLTPSA